MTGVGARPSGSKAPASHFAALVEPEPSRYEREDLYKAIPELMHGGIASTGAKAPKDEPEED